MHPNSTSLWRLAIAAQAIPLLCSVLLAVWLQTNIGSHPSNGSPSFEAAECSINIQKAMLTALATLNSYTDRRSDSKLADCRISLAGLDKTLSTLSGSGATQDTLSEMKRVVIDFEANAEKIVAISQDSIGSESNQLPELFQHCQSDFKRLREISQQFTVWPNVPTSHAGQPFYLLGAALFINVLCYGLAAAYLCLKIAKPLAALEKRMQAQLPAQSAGCPREIQPLEAQFYRLLGAIEDVTAKERAVLEASEHGTLSLSKDLVVQSANSLAAAMFCRPSLVDSSLLQCANAEAMPRLAGFFKEARGSATPSMFELPVMDAAGNERYISLCTRWSNESQLFLCMCNDITDLKQAEESMRQQDKQVRAMLDKMPAALLQVNASGRIIDANDTALQLLSMPKLEVVNKPVKTVLPIPSSNSDADWLKNAANDRPVLLAIGGPERTLHVQARAMEVTLGTAPSFLLLLTDVTSKQSLDILWNRLLDGIAERIVTAVSTIRGLFHRLHREADSLDEENLRFINTAQEECDRLLRLFGEFLEVACAHIGQLSINKQEISTQQLFERTMAAAHVAAKNRDISLFADNNDVRLYADPERLTQVLINLVFNALKFTKSGGSVKLLSEVVGDNTIELRVVDSGAGIPKGMEEKIFDPFKQVSAGDALVRGGSGLGLFICKTIVEKHAGTIVAHNHPQGAVFCVRLPIDDLKAQRLAEFEKYRLVQAIAAQQFERGQRAMATEKRLHEPQRQLLDLMAAQSGRSVEPQASDIAAPGTMHPALVPVEGMELSVEQRILNVIESAGRSSGSETRAGAADSAFAQQRPILSVANDAATTSGKLVQRSWLGLNEEVADRLYEDTVFRSHLPLAPAVETTELTKSFTYAQHKIIAVKRKKRKTSLSSSQFMAASISLVAAVIAVPIFVEMARIVHQNQNEPLRKPTGSVIPDRNVDSSQPLAGSRLPGPVASTPPPVAGNANIETGQSFMITTLEKQHLDQIILSGDALIRQNKPGEAAKIYLDGISKFPHNYPLKIRAIKALIAAKRYEEAKRLCLASLQHAPNNEETSLIKQLLASMSN